MTDTHQVYYWTSVRKNRLKYSQTRGLAEDDITKILFDHVICRKDTVRAETELLRLPGLRKFVERLGSTKEKEDFKKHLRKYISVWLSDCAFEVCTTNRYTINTHEAAIKARREIKKGEIIKYLCGTLVAITPKEEKDLDNRRQDFSIVISQRTKTQSLFLGPARFANHDCQANARLSTTGIDGMQVVATRHIEPDEEITVEYGHDYFGADNSECLCATCESLCRNGWTPPSPSAVRQSLTPQAQSEPEGPYHFRRKRKLGGSGLSSPAMTPDVDERRVKRVRSAMSIIESSQPAPTIESSQPRDSSMGPPPTPRKRKLTVDGHEVTTGEEMASASKRRRSSYPDVSPAPFLRQAPENRVRTVIRSSSEPLEKSGSAFLEISVLPSFATDQLKPETTGDRPRHGLLETGQNHVERGGTPCGEAKSSIEVYNKPEVHKTNHESTKLTPESQSIVPQGPQSQNLATPFSQTEGATPSQESVDESDVESVFEPVDLIKTPDSPVSTPASQWERRSSLPEIVGLIEETASTETTKATALPLLSLTAVTIKVEESLTQPEAPLQILSPHPHTVRDATEIELESHSVAGSTYAAAKESDGELSSLSSNEDFDDTRACIVRKRSILRGRGRGRARNKKIMASIKAVQSVEPAAMTASSAADGLSPPPSSLAPVLPLLRHPGDHSRPAALLAEPYARYVTCSTCSATWVQPNGYYTRRECPRCERHSKLYGFRWPRTDRAKGGPDRIMDHRTVHRFLWPEEEKAVKKRGRGLS